MVRERSYGRYMEDTRRQADFLGNILIDFRKLE